MSAKGSGRAIPHPSELQASGDNEPERRKLLLDIIWGCVSTTFLCTWASVHPNVPPPTTEEFGWKSLLRRLRLVFWALVAPELVLAWSAKQWYVSGKIADTYNHNKGMKTRGTGNTIWSWVKNSLRGNENEVADTKAWTRTHGHLIAMGGIVLIEPEINQTKRDPTILTPEILEDLLKDPGFQITFAEKEIADKAKGDFLSKSIVICQTTWFMVQCAGRFFQNIAITELEVITLALASLNAIMSFFWWEKPLGLAVPMKVYLARKLDRKIERDEVGFKQFLASFTETYATQVLEIFWHNQREPFLIRWFFFLPGYVLALFFLLILWPIIFIATSVYSVMASNSIPTGATHVPTFYSPKNDKEVVVFRIIFPIFGAVFGGLHCLGWTFTFPTETEQKIWRIGSITITVIPILYCLTALSAALTADDGLSTTWNLKIRPIKTVLQAIAGFVAIISVAISWLYLAARMTLLIEAVVLLRKQPSTVFLEVDWTKFVPHIQI